jgi:hypothetical protein
MSAELCSDSALELHLLLAVKVGCAFSEVTGLNNCSLLIALVHCLDQVCIQILDLFLQGRLALDPTNLAGVSTYLFEFILAEKGLAEIFSSMGLLTEGMGMLEIPLSYSRLFRSCFLDLSGTKLFKSIY